MNTLTNENTPGWYLCNWTDLAGKLYEESLYWDGENLRGSPQTAHVYGMPSEFTNFRGPLVVQEAPNSDGWVPPYLPMGKQA
jgi:hypothetical protein